MSKDLRDRVIGADVEIDDVDLAEEEVYVGGERLTDERVEEMAEQSIRIARAREANLVPGGKSLSGDGKHSPVVQTRVSETTRAKLQAIAADRGMSVSKLSRQILDDFVEQASNPPTPAPPGTGMIGRTRPNTD